jgi:hypothetical protein
MHNFVIPVKTGIQCFQIVVCFWIPAYAGMTDFLRVHQVLRSGTGWFSTGRGQRTEKEKVN